MNAKTGKRQLSCRMMTARRGCEGRLVAEEASDRENDVAVMLPQTEKCLRNLFLMSAIEGAR